MKILVIGGTGFIGPHLVRALAGQGHEVTVFHRGATPGDDLPATHILGERSDLARLRPEAEIVIDLVLSSGAQAAALMQTYSGLARRVIAASSIDVYRACGVLHGSEPGPLEPVPLTEDSPLRTKLQTYPPESIKMLRGIFSWLDDEYDKIPVERAIMSNRQLPGTVLRLPMIYGPGERPPRFDPVLRRVRDGRRVILLEETVAGWRAPRGYVENVAAAIVLAAASDRAAGRIYNVAEQPAYSELEWSRMVAEAAGWPGEFRILPKDRMPAHLLFPGNAAQSWETDSSRIRRELGYTEPVSVAEGINRTVASQMANPPAEFDTRQFDYAAEDAALSAAANSSQ